MGIVLLTTILLIFSDHLVRNFSEIFASFTDRLFVDGHQQQIFSGSRTFTRQISHFLQINAKFELKKSILCLCQVTTTQNENNVTHTFLLHFDWLLRM